MRPFSTGWRNSVVHRGTERPCPDPGGSAGAWCKNGRGKNRRCHASMDRSANGARSCREEAVESWREGRRHQTRKSRTIGQRGVAGLNFSPFFFFSPFKNDWIRVSFLSFCRMARLRCSKRLTRVTPLSLASYSSTVRLLVSFR